MMATLLTPWAQHLALEGEPFHPHPDDGGFRFPDGEVYTQCDVSGLEEVVLVHAGAPEPNAGLQFLRAALHRFREEDVTVRLVFTYMPYSRQDSAFYGGTVNQARALLDELVAYREVEEVHAVTPHCGHQPWIADYPFHELHAFHALIDRVRMDDLLVIGPDGGAVERFGIPGYAKDREDAEHVTLSGTMDVEGRNVLVFDDIIATGSSMAAAYDRLQEQGAARVEAAAVHGVMDEGIERVRKTFDGLHLTNTVPNNRANVHIEPVLRAVL